MGGPLGDGMPVVKVGKEVHRKLKLFAALTDRTIQEITNEAVLEYVERESRRLGFKLDEVKTFDDGG